MAGSALQVVDHTSMYAVVVHALTSESCFTGLLHSELICNWPHSLGLPPDGDLLVTLLLFQNPISSICCIILTVSVINAIAIT